MAATPKIFLHTSNCRGKLAVVIAATGLPATVFNFNFSEAPGDFAVSVCSLRAAVTQLAVKSTPKAGGVCDG